MKISTSFLSLLLVFLLLTGNIQYNLAQEEEVTDAPTSAPSVSEGGGEEESTTAKPEGDSTAASASTSASEGSSTKKDDPSNPTTISPATASSEEKTTSDAFSKFGASMTAMLVAVGIMYPSY